MFGFLRHVLKNIISIPSASRHSSARNRSKVRTIESVYINTKNCTFCGICGKRCISKAINVDRNEKVIRIDHLDCILCEACEDVCPQKCISII